MPCFQWQCQAFSFQLRVIPKLYDAVNVNVYVNDSQYSLGRLLAFEHKRNTTWTVQFNPNIHYCQHIRTAMHEHFLERVTSQWNMLRNREYLKASAVISFPELQRKTTYLEKKIRLGRPVVPPLMGTRGLKIVCVLFAAVIQKFEAQHCEVPGCKEEVWAACGAGSCLELMCYEHWMDGSAVHNLTCRGKSQPKCQPKTSECKVHILGDIILKMKCFIKTRRGPREERNKEW